LPEIPPETVERADLNAERLPPEDDSRAPEGNGPADAPYRARADPEEFDPPEDPNGGRDAPTEGEAFPVALAAPNLQSGRGVARLSGFLRDALALFDQAERLGLRPRDLLTPAFVARLRSIGVSSAVLRALTSPALQFARVQSERKPPDWPALIASERNPLASTCGADYKNHWVDRSCGPPLGPGDRSNLIVVTLADGRQIAVKYVRPQDAILSEFRGQVQMMANFNHPCIAKMHGWSQRWTRHAFLSTENVSLLVLELQFWTELACESLESLLERARGVKDHRFWEDTGQVVFLCGIVLGMRAMHARGFVHGDLRAKRILVNARGEALISGVRHAIDIHKEVPTLVRPHSASPESCLDHIWTDKCDVFLFGSLLFHIFAGKPAFPKTLSLYAVIQMLRGGEMPEIPKCGEFFENLIRRCWSFDPKLRPSFDEILNELVTLDFKVLPQVDPRWPREYVRAVQAWEAQYPQTDYVQPSVNHGH
jgi:serine/threonine protein kinase